MKKTIQSLLVLVGLAVAVLCGLDANFWLDPRSGFPLVGGVGIRYGVALVVYVLAAAAGMLACQHTAGLIRRSRAISAAAALCGVLYAMTGVFRLTKAAPVLQQLQVMGQLSVPAALSGCGGDLLMAAGACLGAWVLFNQSAFWCSAVPGEYPAGGVYLAVLELIYPAGLALERFLAHTSSIYRVFHIWQLLSGLLSMLFLLSLVRVTFFPETGRSRSCVRSGLACFYSSTCCELVFVLSQWKQGVLRFGTAADSLLLAGIGVLGLCCALHMLDPDQDRKQKVMDERTAQ